MKHIFAAGNLNYGITDKYACTMPLGLGIARDILSLLRVSGFLPYKGLTRGTDLAYFKHIFAAGNLKNGVTDI